MMPFVNVQDFYFSRGTAKHPSRHRQITHWLATGAAAGVSNRRHLFSVAVLLLLWAQIVWKIGTGGWLL